MIFMFSTMPYEANIGLQLSEWFAMDIFAMTE
jgi:hypothetical protein